MLTSKLQTTKLECFVSEFLRWLSPFILKNRGAPVPHHHAPVLLTAMLPKSCGGQGKACDTSKCFQNVFFQNTVSESLFDKYLILFSKHKKKINKKWREVVKKPSHVL